jgi:hypothetical protein
MKTWKWFQIKNMIIVRVTDSERPDISGSIRSIKMYSYAQCTVVSGEVPCLAQEEQGSAPSTLSTYTPPHLPGVGRTRVSPIFASKQI